MTHDAPLQMRNLCDQLVSARSNLSAEMTEFPSGSAMLDVRHERRAFVMSYSPGSGFHVYEVLPGEGFLTGYRFHFPQFEAAARQLRSIVLSDPPEPSTSSLSLIVLRSRDIDAARSFYTRLGLSFVEEKHGKGPLHFAAMAGSVVIELYPCRHDESSSPIRLGFRVDNVDDTLAKLARTGVRVLSEPKDTAWGRQALVEDPDHNRIELTAAIRKPS